MTWYLATEQINSQRSAWSSCIRRIPRRPQRTPRQSRSGCSRGVCRRCTRPPRSSFVKIISSSSLCVLFSILGNASHPTAAWAAEAPKERNMKEKGRTLRALMLPCLLDVDKMCNDLQQSNFNSWLLWQIFSEIRVSACRIHGKMFAKELTSRGVGVNGECHQERATSCLYLDSL